MHIALVTYSGLPALSADDQLLLPPLAARGIRPAPAAWDDPAVAWGSFDALVIRSTWNYHTVPAAFRAWIDRIERLGVPIWNSPVVLRWNASKSYLRDLQRQGVEIVPTYWVERGSGTRLPEVLDLRDLSAAVVKPAISASAYETWRVDRERITAADEARFARLSASSTMMVQPFLPELERDGEWSLMFIGGEYTHAVLKRPRAGDFRVQHEHGGSAERRTPPAHALETARAIVSRAPGPWLYARVDGVEIEGRFVLVELEMLEPSLFLGVEREAPTRFAEALVHTLHRSD